MSLLPGSATGATKWQRHQIKLTKYIECIRIHQYCPDQWLIDILKTGLANMM